MSIAAVSVKDVIESAKKYGEDSVLEWDPLKFKDNKGDGKDKTKKNKYDCTWVPLTFKSVDGKKMPLKLKFTNIVTASKAKLPNVSGNDDKKKNLQIAFKKITPEEIRSISSIAPKKMSNPIEQEIEDKKFETNINNLVNSTNDFDYALDIINKSYVKICNEIKNSKSLGFSIKKNKQVHKTNDDVPIGSIRQSCIYDDDDKPVNLENPLTRIKLLLSPEGLVCETVWSKTRAKTIEFRPNVYDLERTMKNKSTPVLASVKGENVRESLNLDNAGKFITFQSIIGGYVEFSEISISGYGFSLKNEFKEIYVVSNKNNIDKPGFTEDDFGSMVCGTGENSDDDELVDKIKNVNVNKSKTTSGKGMDAFKSDNLSDSELEDKRDDDDDDDEDDAFDT